ncbi:Holliday junction branch migration protein RuvA [Selenomonas bovis]|jgi:holliday junction DNA helicase RuvA|uniref:Holliday junction branch migration complex subunit RuvA n=1 Tax=Selenomonas bovis TaxID=416586 RepID=A0A848B499_9FIRM|nr:Holliday junction branch migration protein RuvA [Selenomonas bovis]NMD98316.1 Holliday junction branch migration protein RuvA [Selenomonas bovis]
MIGFLRGKVAYLLADDCLLDVGGVGYRVTVSGMTRSKLRQGEQAMLFTYLSVREDALQLYGFATQEEYDVFLQLIGVSGIGPKVALGILSSTTVSGLCSAIANKQASLLTKLPGIGKKSAERLILELKDKLAFVGTGDGEEAFVEAAPLGDGILDEAAAALASLGYTPAETAPVLKQLGTCQTTEEAIRLALKKLSRS